MVIEAIAFWAKRTPDRMAATYNGQNWSYASLAHAIGLARGYFARRQCTGSGIAVLPIRNLIDFWILSLALRSLGLTTVAVGSVASIRAFQLPNLRCVVTGANETVPELDGFCAERGVPHHAVRLGDDPALPIDTSAAVDGGHILLTSGTTGIFKMVLFDAAIDAASHAARQKTYGLDQNAVFNAFDFPPWTLVGYGSPVTSWIAGAQIVLLQGDPTYCTALRHPGQTHAILVPSMLPGIVNGPEGCVPCHPDLNLSITGGGASQAQIDGLRARVTPHLHNRYGSTEAGTIGLTRLEVPDDRLWHRPVPDRRIEIVDDDDRPVPVGQTGRLRVATPVPGYLDDPVTTEAFFKDGFFYPGDLAAWGHDGRFILQGRTTDVLHLRGHKVAPAQAEDRIREALGVTGVCVVALAHPEADDEIIIVVEGAADMDRLQAVVRDEMHGLPRAEVYSVVALPRNHMGKIMRGAVKTHIEDLRGRGGPG